MNKLIAAGIVLAAALAAPSAFAASEPHGWFPHMFETCKQTGRTDAECQKVYDERKAAILKSCEQQGVKGEDDCRAWLEKKRAEQMEVMRGVCKDNGVSGDAACQKWIEDRRAEFIADFRAKCESDKITPEECRARFAESVRATQQRNREFVSDCESAGASVQDCLKKLRELRRTEAQKDAGEAVAPKPPKIEKGQALPPPQ